MLRLKKKAITIKVTALQYILHSKHYFLCLGSEETVNL